MIHVLLTDMCRGKLLRVTSYDHSISLSLPHERKRAANRYVRKLHDVPCVLEVAIFRVSLRCHSPRGWHFCNVTEAKYYPCLQTRPMISISVGLNTGCLEPKWEDLMANGGVRLLAQI